MAKMLGVNGSLTALDLSSNELKDEGVSAVCEAIQSNKETKLSSLNFGLNRIGPVGANAVAAMVAVTGGLTSVELRGNRLGDEGWGAIFAAICGNKDSKIMSMDVSDEKIGPAGVKLIAEALRTSVTGSLTVTNLMRNELDAESAKMLSEVAKQKGISLCGIQRDQTTADFSRQGLKPPDAILLASDLSQAVVTGSLTKMRYVTPQTNLSEFGSDWIHIYIRGASDARDCLCTSLAFASLRRPHLRDAALCAPPLCVPARCMCCKGALLSRISCH